MDEKPKRHSGLFAMLEQHTMHQVDDATNSLTVALLTLYANSPPQMPFDEFVEVFWKSVREDAMQVVTEQGPQLRLVVQLANEGKITQQEAGARVARILNKNPKIAAALFTLAGVIGINDEGEPDDDRR